VMSRSSCDACGIPEYVLGCCEKVAPIQQTRMESALEQLALPSFTGADVSGISAMCFANALGKTRFGFRNGDEVNVVRHQSPCQVANSESLTLLAELPDVLLSIFL